MLVGERGVGGDVGFGVGEEVGDVGVAVSSMSATCRSWVRVEAGSGWAKMVRTVAATISVWPLGTRANRLRIRCTLQRCHAAPAMVSRWLLQPGVGVGDDQFHTRQAPVTERTQELGPEHFVLGVTDVEAEDFPVPVGGDTGRDHHARDTTW